MNVPAPGKKSRERGDRKGAAEQTFHSCKVMQRATLTRSALLACAAAVAIAGCASQSALPSNLPATRTAGISPERRGHARLFPDTFGDPVPEGVTAGPDGAIWFTDSGNDVIGRLTPQGSYTLQVVAGGEVSNGITSGPDGALWFTLEESPARIGRITTGGVVTLFPDPGGAFPHGITTGPDGALWFAESNGTVGRMTTAGRVKHFTVASNDAQLESIVVGPDGAFWITNNVVHATRLSNQVIRMTARGKVKSYTVGSGPDFICAGPDGALWFTEEGAAALGRLTTAGSYSEFSLHDRYAQPSGIATGPDKALWFTDFSAGGKIGRMTTSGRLTFYQVQGDAVEQIARGPGSAMWFSSTLVPAIGKIATR